MKRLLIFTLLFTLLTGCDSKPPYTDNGNPGQIKAVVFYDDNKNGTMDSGETGASQQVAISQEVSCPPSSLPDYVPTDANGEIVFKDLKPGKYCVATDYGFGFTTKLTQEVYVSSDLVTTVMFGLVRNP
ncbi:MAG: hypothetical protein H7Y59_19175 [Anaerolineales bacterium]|nr:hypothetical protein [Anaerolineales bacterium]